MVFNPKTIPDDGGWLPIASDPQVIQQIKMASFLETFGTPVPMSTRTKLTPRSGGVKMSRKGKGAAYTKDTTSAVDDVLLSYDTFGGLIDLDEEDIRDTSSDMVKTFTNDAGASYGRLLDNVSFGITAAKGTSGWNFDSLAYLLTQNETVTGYTANSNITNVATAGNPTYLELSATLGMIETTRWFDAANVVVGAHPKFKRLLRDILDDNGRPILVESSNGTAGGADMTPDSVFGYPVRWSLGFALSAAGSEAPIGAEFMVFGSRSLIKRGDREELVAKYADADSSGYGFDSDVNGLKFRARKAFAPGAVPGFSMLINEAA